MEEILYKIYQAVGAFFTGSQKRRVFYCFVLYGFIGVFSLEFFLKFTVGSEALFWVFSSIVQSLMALVALMGVVVVFKYQNMSTREDRLLEEMNKETSDLAKLGGVLTATSGDELLENIKPHVPEILSNKGGSRTIKLRRVQGELESQKFVRSFLREYMLKVCIYIFSVALFSLLMLAIVPALTSIPFLATASVYLSLFLVADILRLVIKAVASVIEY